MSDSPSSPAVSSSSAQPPSSSSSSSSSTRLSLGTPSNFPVGPAASRKLRKLLVSSTDPSGTVTSFQKHNSLHSYLAKAFGTTPVHELKSARHRQSTRGAREAKTREDESGLRPEPFRPDPALNFLSSLGVARYDVHRRVADALRQALEDEIGRSRLTSPASHDALLNLLKSTWQFASVPELRPVLACLIKKLGEKTPSKVLELLAERSGGTAGGGEFKHADLLARLGLKLRRLVYESDWVARAARSRAGDKDAAAGSTLATDHSALADLVRPAVTEYRGDGALGASSDLAFVGSVRERRVVTQGRRTVIVGSAATGGVGTSGPGHSTAGGSLASIAAASSGVAAKKGKPEGSGKGDSKATGDETSSGNAVVQIKSVVGDRPKLLGAVLIMLVAEHGACIPTSRETVLGGHLYLACPLVSDVLLSFGPLPRQYEHVGLLARVLDNAVKLGAITDDALAQVQGCLRFIYQAEKDIKEKADGKVVADSGEAEKKRKASESAVGTDGGDQHKKKKAKKVASSEATAAAAQHDDTAFQVKLLRKVANAALSALRQSDPQGLFLNPVTDEIAPGYSSVISEPMCLRTMEEKAESTSYGTLSEFERDVQLMYNNCIAYNIGKDGQWFRGEARRQGKVWRDDVMPQARVLFKKEMAKRKKALDRAAKLRAEKEKAASRISGGGTSSSSDANNNRKKKRERNEQEEQKRAARVEKIQKALGAGSAHDQAAARKLTGADVEPLPPSRSKRKKDAELPSMPCLASMMLSDPFVIRLLLDRVLRSIRSDVLKGKTIPAGHKTVPSLMQLLHMAQFSTRMCAAQGRHYFVPDVGFASKKDSGGGEQQKGDDSDPESDVPYASLRRYTPLLAGLLLETDLDRRMVAGGDLFDAASAGAVPALPEADPSRWEDGSGGGQGVKGSDAALRTAVPRALVGCGLVHLVQPGNSNEAALKRQYPRFAAALGTLAGTDLTHERPFFVSLTRALLRHKSKMLHGTRDAVAESWIGWIRGGGKVGKKKRRRKDVMSSAVHECFVHLLNEWAALGNILLPRDAMLKLAEEAVAAAECVAGEGAFARRWAEDGEDFALVKAEYVKMLEGVPGSRADQWKEKAGIDDSSLKVLAEKVERKREDADSGTNVDL